MSFMFNPCFIHTLKLKRSSDFPQKCDLLGLSITTAILLVMLRKSSVVFFKIISMTRMNKKAFTEKSFVDMHFLIGRHWLTLASKCIYYGVLGRQRACLIGECMHSMWEILPQPLLNGCCLDHCRAWPLYFGPPPLTFHSFTWWPCGGLLVNWDMIIEWKWQGRPISTFPVRALSSDTIYI